MRTVSSKGNSFWRLTLFTDIFSLQSDLDFAAVHYFAFDIYSCRMGEKGKLPTVDGYITTQSLVNL